MRIEPGDAAALAKQHHGVAGDAAIAFGDQHLGGLAFDQLAEGAAGNAVAGENSLLDGGEVIDVGRAGLANLGRHAGLENLDWVVEKALVENVANISRNADISQALSHLE